MGPVTETTKISPANGHAVPPLQNGDRLTRDEFERRYEAMPSTVKAELIEGVVYVASPVNFENHSGPHFDLIIWLGMYRTLTFGVRGGDNATVKLDLVSEPQPDGCLFIMPPFGQLQIDDTGYLVGAPELAAEVAASGASYDLHDKLDAYRRNGVQEYVVWRVFDRTIDWFVLRQGEYERLTPSSPGHYRSVAFPGLWLNAQALLAGNMPEVIQELQRGVASQEHADFVVRLQQAGNAKEST